MTHEPITLRAYIIVFIALMVLLVATVAATFLPFGRWNLHALSVAVALTIAVVKATIVVLYFMHVKIASRLTRVFVVAGLFWLGILIVLTLSDYLSRGWLPVSSGWTVETPVPSPPP